MHGEVHVSVHACTSDYLRCAICEVYDRVRKHVIRCTKKSVPRFLILEALVSIPTSLEGGWWHFKNFSEGRSFKNFIWRGGGLDEKGQANFWRWGSGTAWNVSKYGVIFGPYFLVFGLNTEIYEVILRIQFEYRKIRPRNNSVFGHFSRNEGFRGSNCKFYFTTLIWLTISVADWKILYHVLFFTYVFNLLRLVKSFFKSSLFY